MQTIKRLALFFLLPLIFYSFNFKVSGAPHQDTIRNICAYLGNRSDKNFLGSGNMALVIEPARTKVLFVQQWKEKGLFDWASGNVKNWYPDRIEMKDPVPPTGATISHQPLSRTIFICRDDIAGMELVWKNNSSKTIAVEATFNGYFPANAEPATVSEDGVISAVARYSDKVNQPVYYLLGAAGYTGKAVISRNEYRLNYSIEIKPGEIKSLTLLLHISIDQQLSKKIWDRWITGGNIKEAARTSWNQWFRQEVPQFSCSDAYTEKLYYYRWWSLYTKMIFAKIGHFYYPAPREGTVAYDGVVSYSGACISVDELRWMHNPSWAFSATREFFAAENMNDGYLSNHIWDWGIDADSSNMDQLGRSVPYNNYAVDAFYGASLVHPKEGLETLPAVWPQFRSNLDAYNRLFDIDKDGLYETYPWSNAAGQEWSARFSYFDPIPEIFRNERSRTYMPDGSRKAEDMELMQKIKASMVTDPAMQWPQTPEELYRLYYATADHRLATVDQTAYAYKNFVAASHLAGLLKDTALKLYYAQMSERSKQQLYAVMWNENDHYFYDVQPLKLQQAKIKSTTGFYPFWACIAQKKHVPMLQHIFNPSTFWTNYPLPSLPLDYEKYAALQKAGWNYWNYATWPRTTCHVVDGTLWAAKKLDASLTKNAVTLFEKYTRMHFPQGDLQRPNIAERYDPHTGQPFMEELDYNHSSYIDLLLLHAAGITPADADSLIVNPVDMGWKSFSFTNIRYRNHMIDVLFNRKKGMEVKVDGVVKASTPVLRRVTVSLDPFK